MWLSWFLEMEFKEFLGLIGAGVLFIFALWLFGTIINFMCGRKP